MRKKNYSEWSLTDCKQALRFQQKQPWSKYPGVNKRRSKVVEALKKRISEIEGDGSSNGK